MNISILLESRGYQLLHYEDFQESGRHFFACS